MTKKIFLRYEYVELINALANAKEHAEVRSWFLREEVRDLIESKPEYRKSYTGDQIQAKLSHIKRPKVVENLEQHLRNVPSILAFEATPELRENIKAIVKMFREAKDTIEAGRSIPDEVWMEKWGNLDNACRAVEVWRAWKEKQAKNPPLARKKLVSFENGLTLYACLSTQEAIRVGKEVGNCLKQYLNPPHKRWNGLKAYEAAISRQDLQYLEDQNGKIVAVLCLDSTRSEVQEVNGPRNRGLARSHAFTLRRYLKKRGFLPSTKECARFLGMVHVRQGKGYVNYENEIHNLLASSSPDLSGLPVNNKDVAVLCGRKLDVLNISHCANITHLPDILEAKSIIVYVNTQKEIFEFQNVAAANEWLDQPVLKRELLTFMQSKRLAATCPQYG